MSVTSGPRVGPAPVVPGRGRTAGFWLLIEAGFFTAPFSGAIVQIGMVRFRAADGLLGIALIVAFLQIPGRRLGLVRVPLSARRVEIGIALVSYGILIGTWRNGGKEYLLLFGFGVAAAVPTMLLVQARVTAEMRRRLARVFVAGTCTSVATAVLLGYRNAAGAAVGLTLHRNQLGMTIAMSFPLVGLLSRRWQRLSAYAVLVVGANETGSRSAVLGLLVAACLMSLMWIRGKPSRVALLVFVPLLAGTLIFLASGIGGGEQTTLSRLAGNDASRVSDFERRGAITDGLDALDLDTGLFGSGYFLDPPPHNVVIETWLAGGLVALFGLMVVLREAFHPIVRTFRSRRSAWPLTDVTRFAISVSAWLVVVLFNNVLWVPFVWVMVALSVAGLGPHQVRASQNSERLASQTGRVRRAGAP